ncbi:MAG: serine hydrolase domain-containing protein [Cystobacter sp.]
MRTTLPRFILLMSLFGVCATTRTADARTAHPASATLQRILDEAAADMKSPGLVMAVQVGNSPPWIGVTGCQDQACTRRMTPDMKFRVGSITKNFVGTAILQQVDEGKIRLEDSLEKWLPGVFSNIDGQGITIRHLLGHTSGIETYTEHPDWMPTVYMKPTHLWNAPQELLQLAELLRQQSIENHTVIQPGSRFAYSNTNFILLGMIAAKVDGYGETEWAKVIQNRFFKKLAMNASRIPAVAETRLGSTNQGYVNFYNFSKDENGVALCLQLNPNCTDSDQDFTAQDMSNAWSAGGIISTVDDLRKWINAEVKGHLLSGKIRQEQRKFMNTCTQGDSACKTPDVQVGLAMFRQTRFGFIGHRGEIFGFNGTIQYLPQKDLTVVVLSNRTALDGNHVGPIPEKVAAALFPDLAIEGLPLAGRGQE